MKYYTFKIGVTQLVLESNKVEVAYLLASAWKEHNKVKGKIILIGIQN